MVSILKKNIFFALGGIVFAVWSLKCLLFKSSYTVKKQDHDKIELSQRIFAGV